MKYLQDYMEKEQSAAIKDCGAFFAFSVKQFEEKRVEGVTYADMGAGLICPKDNAKKLSEAIDEIYEKGIALDMEENGKKNIIWRELANHECQIVGNSVACIEALMDYPIEITEINDEWKAFYSKYLNSST